MSRTTVFQSTTCRTCGHKPNSFFALPEHIKTRYDIGRIKRHRGFVPVGALTAGPDEDPDQQEGYEIALELPDDDPDYLAGSKLFGPNVWPDELPEFQNGVYGYFESVFSLGCKLFGAFALALDLPKDYFDGELRKPIAQLRLLYYPRWKIKDPNPRWVLGPTPTTSVLHFMADRTWITGSEP
ncbi:MAG: hypothetical protein Ct9H300mP16_19100 [Pseudomonadota bacterium]|nr:MAG: hypothetical protein Ct9H300mP16_19100 [Pseudomonadota bacterium]